MEKNAFYVVWTMRHRASGHVLIDATLAGGPVSTRELAEFICDVEREYKASRYDDAYEHLFAIIERPLEAPEYWDNLYDDAWKQRHLKGVP